MTGKEIYEKLKPNHTPRFFSLVVSAALFALLYFIAPEGAQVLPITLQKLVNVSLGAALGFQIDKIIFPYASPGDYQDLAEEATQSGNKEVREFGKTLYQAHNTASIRRAIIVVGAILAAGLGL